MRYFRLNTDTDSLCESPRPRFRLLLEGGFFATGGSREKYGAQLCNLSPGDIVLLYENRVGVVAIGAVRERWDGVAHLVPRYYKPSELPSLDGAEAEYRIAVDWVLDLSDSPIPNDVLDSVMGKSRRGTVRPLVKWHESVAAFIDELRQSASLRDEAASDLGLREGARTTRRSSEIVRNRTAIAHCKASHGTRCAACKIDFGATYGAALAGFIHVHHVRPIASVGEEYEIDPERDLVPICPNCHAVIHFGGGLRSVDAVRAMLESARIASIDRLAPEQLRPVVMQTERVRR